MFKYKTCHSTISQEAGVVAVSKTCFTMATDGILETLATKYPQVLIVKLDIFGNRNIGKKTDFFGKMQDCKIGLNINPVSKNEVPFPVFQFCTG